MDAQHVAKSKGADIVKQWDSTLDGNTRDLHRLLDGQIREIDEPFEVGGRKVEAPGMFGDPAEDCNCRCCLLQRARWALDDDELQTLKDRAAYFDLDKTKEFEEYQEKYLGITQEDIDNIKNSVKIKKIELPSETDNIKGMSNETKQAICDAFDKIKEEYNVRICISISAGRTYHLMTSRQGCTAHQVAVHSQSDQGHLRVEASLKQP